MEVGSCAAVCCVVMPAFANYFSNLSTAFSERRGRCSVARERDAECMCPYVYVPPRRAHGGGVGRGSRFCWAGMIPRACTPVQTFTFRIRSMLVVNATTWLHRSWYHQLSVVRSQKVSLGKGAHCRALFFPSPVY